VTTILSGILNCRNYYTTRIILRINWGFRDSFPFFIGRTSRRTRLFMKRITNIKLTA